jgi:hypothetical protein
MKHFNQITIDKITMSGYRQIIWFYYELITAATVGPGCLLGDVTKVMRQAGVMTPHGVSPSLCGIIPFS